MKPDQYLSTDCKGTLCRSLELCLCSSPVFCYINLAILDFLTSKLYLLISGRFPRSLWVLLPILKPENSPGSKPEQILALTSFVSLLSGITVVLHFPSSIVLKTMDIKYISYIFIFHTFCPFFFFKLFKVGR